jgi:hypothetical protein
LHSAPPDEAPPYDGVLVEVTQDDDATEAWVKKTVASIDRMLSADGVAYVVAPRRFQHVVSRCASAHGLVTAAYLHVPSGPSAEYVARCDASGLNLLAGILPMRPLRERLVRAGLKVRLADGWLPFPATRIGIALQRPAAPPLCAWTRRPPHTRGEVTLLRLKARGASRTAVLWTIAPGAASQATVIKRALTRDAVERIASERAAIERIGPSARHAGATIPAIDPTNHTDSGCVRYGLVPGVPADVVLGTAPDRLSSVMEQITAWLARWNQATRVWRTIDTTWLRRELLDPAHAAAALLDEPEPYFRWLSAGCGRLAGRSLAFVATHGDLTMSNVLVGDDRRLSIVDWESARTEGVPLSDLYYATADARAASARYRDRADVLVQVFGAESTSARSVAAAAMRIDPTCASDADLCELLRHAAVLPHAVNEMAKGRSGPQPFATALRAMAAGVKGRR